MRRRLLWIFVFTFFHQIIRHRRNPTVMLCVMHILSSFSKQTTPLSNLTVTHNIWPINLTKLPVNFSCTIVFAKIKTWPKHEPHSWRIIYCCTPCKLLLRGIKHKSEIANSWLLYHAKILCLCLSLPSFNRGYLDKKHASYICVYI